MFYTISKLKKAQKNFQYICGNEVNFGYIFDILYFGIF